MKNFLNTGVTYVLLWGLYNLRGVLYSFGGGVSRILLLVILIWSLYLCYVVNFKQRQPLPAFLKAVNVFLIIATIYGIILILSGQELLVVASTIIEIPNYAYLRDIYTSLLPLYAVYYYVNKGDLDEERLSQLILLFVLITWARYFYNKEQLTLQAMARGSSREEFTNNTGYSFLSLIPLLFLGYKKPLLQYLLFLLTIIGIFLCMKRGAIAIGVLCFVYFIFATFKTTKSKYRFTIVLLSLVVIVSGIFVVQEMFSTSDYFKERVEQTVSGDSSGRDYLYGHFWNVFIDEPNPLKILFGRGANATLKVGTNYAHNDWLELMINQGFLGVCIYIYYFLSLFKDYKTSQKRNKRYANVLSVSLFIMLSQSLISMSYYSMEITQTLAIGFVLGANNLKKSVNYTPLM